MKGKLEELNEPVDDLMEVSKVQTQILNLTGNQVDIFDSTTEEFRSTYDILKDISEVWDNLSSVNRAKLTEILFGKNRANTGLAIIQAFQSGQIESAYKAALHAEGTAVEENERLMQGLQAQLDALKGSFQNLANATLKSSFLKSIIQGAGSLLDLLTKIVDKVGALPPLLTAVGTFAGLQNVNFVSMFSSIIGGGATVGVSDAIKSYNQLLATEGKQVAMQKVMNGQFANGNVAFKQYIAGLDGAKASVSGYVTQLGIAKVKTVALQAATVAMNAVVSLGISLAISAAISAITKLIKAEEEQLKKQEDIRQEGQKAVDNYKSEAKEIASLRDEYVKLYSTTDDLSSVQDRLLEIQNKLNKSYSDSKGQVDLLNGSLKENLELLQKQEYDEAKKAQRDLAADYEAVKQDSNFLNWEDYSKLQTVGIDSKTTKAISKKLEQGFIDFFNVNTDYLVHEWKDSNTGETKRRYENALQVDRENGSFFVGGATQEEALENLGRIVDMYKQWEGHDETTLQNLVKINTATQERVKHNKDVLDTIAKTDKIISDYEESLGSDKANRLNEILAEAAEKINKLQEATGYEKFGISQELDKLKSEAQSLAGDNVILADSVKSVFATYTKEISSATGGLEEWRSAWFESLDEVKQGALKNIDSMKSALQNVAGGGLLTWEEFWGLEELDENKILSPVQMIGDKVKVTEEQLITLKDAYIQKQLESLQIEQATREANYQSALKDVQHYTALLREYDEARYGSKNLNNPSYRKYISSQDEINAKIRESQAEVDRLGQEWELTNTVVEAYKSNLGNTVDRQKQLTDLTKKLQDEADNLLKAQEYRIDQIIDKYENEKEAIEDAKKVLEDQLAVLEEQEDALKNTIENYKTAAETVQSAIQEQIDKIKEENEERENALDLATKLANLENARNKKVRIYTEAGGWQYEAKKSDVEKAKRELEKTKEDERIKLLEAQLKKWQNITDKRQKAENERLAEEILGADWRLKISEQDEEIFNKYEKEYDAYGDQLWQISNVEIATLKKSIEAKDKDIAAKEAQIKEWQKYKSAVQKVAEDVKDANSDYMQYLSEVQVNENSTLQDRENNLTRFRNTYAGILEELTAKQNELNSAANNYDTSSMLGQVNALADEMEQLEIKWDKVYEMMRNNHYAGSASDAEYYYGYKVGEGYADGGVSSRTGLAMLHGTKQRSETIFNANDSAKLYDLVHSTPNLVATALTDGVSIARGLTNTSNDSRSVTLNGTTINLPNVQNAEQFARQFESYMQTVLAESQVYKPSR